MHNLDTLVNFSTVDMPPTFVACESFIDKQQKSTCFGKEIQALLSKELQASNFKVKVPIDEVVQITLRINQEGVFSLKTINSPQLVLEQLPDLKKRLEKSVKAFPKVFPAIKRGIPVATEYVVPIQIKLVE